MSLLDAAELAAWLGEPADQPRLSPCLAAAEVLVAARLGAPGLEERSVAVTLTVARERRVVELPEGPLTHLEAVSLDGRDLPLDELATAPWLIARATPFPCGGRLALAYLAGWAAEALPEALRRAVLLTAGSLWARGADSETGEARLGDYAVQHGSLHDGLPAPAVALIRPWRRP